MYNPIKRMMTKLQEWSVRRKGRKRREARAIKRGYTGEQYKEYVKTGTVKRTLKIKD